MTRFREEHYATRAYRAALKVPRTDNASDPFVTGEGSPSRGQERRALRSEFFKKKGKRPAPGKAQKRMIEDA